MELSPWRPAGGPSLVDWVSCTCCCCRRYNALRVVEISGRSMGEDSIVAVGGRKNARVVGYVFLFLVCLLSFTLGVLVLCPQQRRTSLGRSVFFSYFQTEAFSSAVPCGAIFGTSKVLFGRGRMEKCIGRIPLPRQNQNMFLARNSCTLCSVGEVFICFLMQTYRN